MYTGFRFGGMNTGPGVPRPDCTYYGDILIPKPYQGSPVPQPGISKVPKVSAPTLYDT
jgi:hypothetical protein